jgi:predicted fused transcriptional regulator/phosphomethylpyrimidine kinase
MNLGYAIREARGTEDVAAFPGRISERRGMVYLKGNPSLGPRPMSLV